MYYQCPVCGFSQMPLPPREYHICPCCGTEFGYDDFSRTHLELRNEWLSQEAVWFDPSTPPAWDWNPFRQVIEAGLLFDVPIAAHSSSKTTGIRVKGDELSIAFQLA